MFFKSDEMNALWDTTFDGFFGGFFPEKNYSTTKQTGCNITTTDNETIIKLDVPGVKKEDINVEINNDILTIKAYRKDLEKEQTTIKSWKLNPNFDTSKISSKLEDGVLTIACPKVEKKNKKIEIPIL